MDARAREDLRGSRAAAAIDLDALKARVRRDMIGRVDGDLIPGLRVVSAPVFDLQGRMVLAITSIASPAIDREGDAEAEAALIAACRDLTLSLGGRWPAPT